ncbi:MAG: hypothetical protein CBC12_13505 [Candidatus Puniceispirillum sp. TMED52]|nr:hypothetical protein [SAR116 cluster bacterium]OUU44471.1 MAG: hypothetical protein CBC12_13505 [Candidatus Puniceispirillum sp. TMED52]HCP19163.1 hypothetical protein [Alphaproteobacteria bacterium]|tara:strand:+ start:790 stop:987 length:198 start_codon:yes stop_codon:yes gene_type:complete
MYENDWGVEQDYVEQDYDEAVKWYRMAAKQGHTVAQFNLGWMYDFCEGIEQDYKQAFYWYCNAAE